MVEDDEEGTDAGPPSAAAAAVAAGASPTGKARGLREGPKVVFQVVPKEQATPPQTDTIRRVAAAVLGLLLIGSSLQLALATNITKLPAETLAWLSNPENVDSNMVPPGLENWDPTSYIETALPVLSGLLAVQVAHEAGHRIAAAIKGVKLGPSFFVPYSQVGSFGAITPFTSVVKDRAQLWDVAAAGPLAGALASMALLAIGLMQSTGGDVAAVDPAAVVDASAAVTSQLVAVPSGLFQVRHSRYHACKLTCILSYPSSPPYLLAWPGVAVAQRRGARSAGRVRPAWQHRARVPARHRRLVRPHHHGAQHPAGRLPGRRPSPAGCLREAGAVPHLLLHLPRPGPGPPGQQPGAPIRPLRHHLPAHGREVHQGQCDPGGPGQGGGDGSGGAGRGAHSAATGSGTGRLIRSGLI